MKSKVYFTTGNVGKAEYLAKFLDMEVEHKKIDLEEIQSMDLKEIVQKKVRAAYDIVQAPVIVEDISLEFKVLNGLPGPFIKFFVDNMKLQDVCDLLGEDKSRGAKVRCVFGYFDGENERYFEENRDGMIAKKPEGDGGYG